MNYMILSICEKSYMVQIFLIIKIFFKMLCILAPIIIIIASIYSVFKTIKSGKDEDIKDNLTMLVRRVIAGLLIFFLPSIISYVFTNLVKAGDVSFLTCFETASAERVKSLKEKEAAEAKAEAEREKREAEALEKENYQKDQAERDKQKKVFEEEKKKREEEERRKAEAAGSTTGSVTTISTSQKGVSIKQFNASNGVNMKYFEILPDNMKSNLPLIVYLHGDGEVGNVEAIGSLPITNFVKNSWDHNSQPFIFIAPSTNITSWTTNGIPQAVKGLIDNAVKEYNVDTNHIIIAGASRGAIGTWYMVEHYGSFFSAAMPMSCCAQNQSAGPYVSVPIYAISGTSGSDEAGYNSCMSGLVNSINAAGGHAIKDTRQGESHNTIAFKFADKKLFEWMLSQ